jgi:tRNA threonylcarbamoyladenosine biosynthesis protein TsaE
VTRSASGTAAAGAALARRLRPGDCVLLSGPLGAGKTVFVRGAWRALGVRRPATSPTFILAHEGRGRWPVVHLDFYRLTVPAAARGLDEYLDGRWIVFAEWPERDRSFAPPGAIRVRIDRLDGCRRRIAVSLPGGRR